MRKNQTTGRDGKKIKQTEATILWECVNSKNQFCYNVFWLTNIRKKIMRKMWVFKTEYKKAHAFKAKTPSNIRISTRKLKSHYKLAKKKKNPVEQIY